LAKVLGGIGRVFILAGLFILGFVAFQLWGTGLEEGRNQSALSDQLTESAPVGSKIADAGDPADVASALAKVDTATAPVAMPAPAAADTAVYALDDARVDAEAEAIIAANLRGAR